MRDKNIIPSKRIILACSMLCAVLCYYGLASYNCNTYTGHNACHEHDKAKNYPHKHDTVDTIWPRLTSNFKIQQPNPKLHKHLQRYISSFGHNHANIIRLTSLAEPYLFHVMEVLEDRDLPGELALVPMIESAYKPLAQSSRGASGLWQLRTKTGRRFGLRQDSWYDGRRDVAASTQAALDYLEFLHAEFSGDWLLAFAAYNAGEGRVKKAIKVNKARHISTDFWSLDLPAETKHFVPKILALAKIISEHQAYHIKLHPIANQPYFKNFSHTAQIDLRTAADIAHIDLDQLKLLNPAFMHDVTHPDGPHEVLVPSEIINTLQVHYPQEFRL